MMIRFLICHFVHFYNFVTRIHNTLHHCIYQYILRLKTEVCSTVFLYLTVCSITVVVMTRYRTTHIFHYLHYSTVRLIYSIFNVYGVPVYGSTTVLYELESRNPEHGVQCAASPLRCQVPGTSQDPAVLGQKLSLSVHAPRAPTNTSRQCEFMEDGRAYRHGILNNFHIFILPCKQKYTFVYQMANSTFLPLLLGILVLGVAVSICGKQGSVLGG